MAETLECLLIGKEFPSRTQRKVSLTKPSLQKTSLIICLDGFNQEDSPFADATKSTFDLSPLLSVANKTNALEQYLLRMFLATCSLLEPN